LEPSYSCEKFDEKAFLFSMRHNEKYLVIPSKPAIYPYNNHLLLFGSGNPDIFLVDNCNTADNFTYFPRSYRCSKISQEIEERKAYLDGNFSFKIEDIEVYQVVRT